MASPLAFPVLSRRNAIFVGGASALLALGNGQPAWAEDAASLEANKTLVQRVFDEVINGGRVALLVELYAPGFVDRDTRTLQGLRPAGLPMPLAEFRALFPHVLVTVDAAVAEGNLVATHETWWDGHPPFPSGRHSVGRTMHLFRIAGGQIVEQRSAGWEWVESLTERVEPIAANPLMSG